MTNSSILPRLASATLVTALSDGLFSSVLVTAFYHSTFAKLWQGVASTLIGPSAMNGGARTVWIGITMHVGVALAWSIVFLVAHDRMASVRRLASTPTGALTVAAVYGPMIWLVMSLVVIPALRHAPPAITIRWWVQFFGHIPFVAMPIVWSIARPAAERVARVVAAA